MNARRPGASNKGEVLTDVMIAEIREIFSLFDKDADGFVQTNDLGTIVRGLNFNRSRLNTKSSLEYSYSVTQQHFNAVFVAVSTCIDKCVVHRLVGHLGRALTDSSEARTQLGSTLPAINRQWLVEAILVEHRHQASQHTLGPQSGEARREHHCATSRASNEQVELGGLELANLLSNVNTRVLLK